MVVVAVVMVRGLGPVRVAMFVRAEVKEGSCLGLGPVGRRGLGLVVVLAQG
jgi:hypothetical protein